MRTPNICTIMNSVNLFDLNTHIQCSYPSCDSILNLSLCFQGPPFFFIKEELQGGVQRFPIIPNSGVFFNEKMNPKGNMQSL